jgi:peptidase E
MNETINNPPTAPIERQRMDMDIVCVGFGSAFGLMLQIATSKKTDGEMI